MKRLLDFISNLLSLVVCEVNKSLLKDELDSFGPIKLKYMFTALTAVFVVSVSACRSTYFVELESGSGWLSEKVKCMKRVRSNLPQQYSRG